MSKHETKDTVSLQDDSNKASDARKRRRNDSKDSQDLNGTKPRLKSPKKHGQSSLTSSLELQVKYWKAKFKALSSENELKSLCLRDYHQAEVYQASHQVKMSKLKMSKLKMPKLKMSKLKMSKHQDSEDPAWKAPYYQDPTWEITNQEFSNIRTHKGEKCYWPDSVLNVALSLELRLAKSAETAEIQLLNTNDTQALYGTINDIDPSNLCPTIVERCADKQFIFIIINNGILQDAGCAAHWSLVLINRRFKEALYLDSMKKDTPMDMKIPHTIVRGLGSLLREDYGFKVDPNSPHQVENNWLGRKGHGECGPFVFEMVKRQIRRIAAQPQIPQSLLLPPDFASSPAWNWNSLDTRAHVYHLIAHAAALERKEGRRRQSERGGKGGGKGGSNRLKEITG